MQSLDSHKQTTITIIAVLYNKQLEESATVRSLKRYLNKLDVSFQVVIYNNSPEIKLSDPEYIIINANENSYLAHAYNVALSYANEARSKWILLLDDDTEITEDYFVQLNRFLHSHNIAENIATVAPFLSDHNHLISPHKISKYGWWNGFKVQSGINGGHVTAFNSLTLIKTKAIQSIGGFSEQYPLDMLDHWYYWKLHKAGYTTWVLNTNVTHNLSLSDYSQNITPERHTSILSAERQLTREMGTNYYITYKIRLFLRLIKQIFSLRNRTFTQITLKTLLMR